MTTACAEEVLIVEEPAMATDSSAEVTAEAYERDWDEALAIAYRRDWDAALTEERDRQWWKKEKAILLKIHADFEEYRVTAAKLEADPHFQQITRECAESMKRLRLSKRKRAS